MNYSLNTQNYLFQLHVEDIQSPIHIRRFTIGDEKGLCLEASIIMEDADERFAFDKHICNVAQLDALESCLLEQSDTDAGLGTEILYGFINVLKANYPHITHLTLRDASYVPCNRLNGETLDLLTYNIAIYGKTWYEMVLGAYISNSSSKTKYEEGIKQFESEKAKANYTWEKLYVHIARNNVYAAEKIQSKLESFKKIFEESKNWSMCFEQMKKEVPKEDKCKFFKTWLEKFVYSYVPEYRDWTVNIVENPILGNVLDVSKTRPIRSRTRRLRRRLS